jgi:hypothetical protein
MLSLVSSPFVSVASPAFVPLSFRRLIRLIGRIRSFVESCPWSCLWPCVAWEAGGELLEQGLLVGRRLKVTESAVREIGSLEEEGLGDKDWRLRGEGGLL